MRFVAGITATLVAAVALGGAPDVGQVNGSVSVDPNEQAGRVWTVNGSISVGDHATVGEVSTVNGRIAIGAGVRAASLRAVNGSIAVGKETHVSGDTTTVNGTMLLKDAAEVSGRLSTVNGSIRLVAAHVGHGIQTVTGDIEIGSDSRVEGGILVKKRYSWGWGWLYEPPPSIVVIAPRAAVTGTLEFQHAVRLYVSDRATIGPIEGAKPIFYSGEHPVP